MHCHGYSIMRGWTSSANGRSKWKQSDIWQNLVKLHRSLFLTEKTLSWLGEFILDTSLHTLVYIQWYMYTSLHTLASVCRFVSNMLFIFVMTCFITWNQPTSFIPTVICISFFLHTVQSTGIQASLIMERGMAKHLMRSEHNLSPVDEWLAAHCWIQ